MPAFAQKKKEHLFRLHLFHESSDNLQIKNGYLLFIMSADKPPVGSCEVYSNVAFRDGIVRTFLHS